MTEHTGNRNTGTRRGTTAGKKKQNNTTGKKKTANAAQPQKEEMDLELKYEIILVSILAVVVFLFLCTIGVIGSEEGNLGNSVKAVMLGLFGYLAYIFPFLIFIGVAFGISNAGSRLATVKLYAGAVLVILAGIVCHMISNSGMNEAYESSQLVSQLYQAKNGGGVVFGWIGYGLYQIVGNSGCIFVVLVLSIICLILLTQRPLIKTVKEGSKKVYHSTLTDVQQLKQKRVENESKQQEVPVKQKNQAPFPDEETTKKELRIHKKVSGITSSTVLEGHEMQEESNPEEILRKNDIHEITQNISGASEKPEKRDIHIRNYFDDGPTPVSQPDTVLSPVLTDEPDIIEMKPLHSVKKKQESAEPDTEIAIPVITNHQSDLMNHTYQKKENESLNSVSSESNVHKISSVKESIDKNPVMKPEISKPKKPYRFPSVQLLNKPKVQGSGSNNRQLKETGLKLEQILETFGVKVSVTDISQGPAVTRYELQPEQGVKVSKILSLSDDIKLNLAASDIRIEAPIPGKAAVGIEVPNTSSSSVCLRELIELKEFQDFSSKLAFAVGRDIAGMPVIADIAKMPHMLIAGATGSGKSVCINTIIMSILYKADPEDVKLIMIDPKVVELSVYNGIPHLMIPVVTDPKKAASALQWGVAEMTDRYKKFADLGVRDLKGYNQKIQNSKDSVIKENESEAPLVKLPQILIIVDELADLMMVASKDVEEAICRLAQLARAAGIHLIIATQRPSVDVITGLIKANMPSRVAFSVSSGVDSRTILDMNGAEKLLGKGDMLFYPQGYTKPSRIQGAFVTDEEVQNVTDFVKNQNLNPGYYEELEAKMEEINNGGLTGVSSSDDYDMYFSEAGRLVIDKDKASIGMLQRAFKIGFNRAARIVDQLEASNVVSAEDGTKPRRVLMSIEEFEEFITHI